MPRTSPNRKEFFKVVKAKITDNRLRIAIEFAYNFAKEAHRPQPRDDGERYFEHVKSVAWIILTETNITDQFRLTILTIASLFHDLVEDTYVAKRKHIKFMFDQICPDIELIIWEVTKPNKLKGTIKWKKLLASRRVATKITKGADRLHNLRTLTGCSREKIVDKIDETEKIILPWLSNNRSVFPRCEIDTIEILVKKIKAELVRLHIWLEEN